MRLLFLLTLIFCTQFAIAQESMGIKGGLNIVTLVTSQTGTSQTSGGSGGFRPSYHGGFFYNSAGDGSFDFRMELLYSNKGKGTGSRANSNRNTTHLHYFTLPLMGVFKPIDGLDLQFGAEAGFLLAARQKAQVTSNTAGATIDYNGDVLNLYKRFDAGIVLGVSHSFDSGITLGARYSFGLFNINNLGTSSTTTNSLTRIQTRTTMISLEYAIFQN